jgi:hypothetical protein
MHVTRQRVTKARQWPFGLRTGRRIRLVAAGTAALAITGGGVAYASTGAFGNNRVGTTYKDGLQLASEQIIKPIGDRLLVDNGKLLASTVSPDGRFLAALTNDRAIALTIVDLKTYKVLQQAGTDKSADVRIAGNNVGQGRGRPTRRTAGRCGSRRSTASPASR